MAGCQGSTGEQGTCSDWNGGGSGVGWERGCERGGSVGTKALAPHLTVALEKLALLSDVRQKMQRAEGATERRKTQSSHSSSIFMYQKRHCHTTQEIMKNTSNTSSRANHVVQLGNRHDMSPVIDL